MIRRTIRVIRAARTAARDTVEGYLDLQIARADALKLRAAVSTLKAELGGAEIELDDLRAAVKHLSRLASDSRGVFRCVVSGHRHLQNPGTILACAVLIERIDAIIPASEGR